MPVKREKYTFFYFVDQNRRAALNKFFLRSWKMGGVSIPKSVHVFFSYCRDIRLYNCE